MFRGWCLSINEMRGHRLQLGAQHRRTQAKSKEGDFFFFLPSKRNEVKFCSVLHLQLILFFHKTWWLLRRESLLCVAGRGVTITHMTRFPFACKFVDFADKPLPLGFLVVSAAFPTVQWCFLCYTVQTGEQLKPKNTHRDRTPHCKQHHLLTKFGSSLVV